LLPPAGWFHFHEASVVGYGLLARHLQRTVRRIGDRLGNVAYNILWRLPPLTMAPVPYYRWRLEILPRLTTFAGFELASGIYINPILPEQSAAELRQATSAASQRR
jgi:UDPglucose--hexose-1-phosphate uridylyltransferase